MSSSFELPPGLSLLMDELTGDFSSSEEFAHSYKRIAKDVAMQSETSFESFDYFDKGSDGSGGLVITASGGLNPFSEHYLCSQPSCRVKATREIARTLGLYGDIVVVPDTLSYVLAGITKPTYGQLRWIATQLLVLKELEPLFRTGVMRFSSGRMSLCSSCLSTMEAQIKACVEELSDQLDEYLHVDLYEEQIAISATGPLEGPTSLWKKLTQADKKLLKSGVTAKELAKETYLETVEDRVRSTLFELSFARGASSLLMSTARTELFALRSFDEHAPALNDLAVWEQARSVQLPWVNGLSTEEIVQLRHEASNALPAFRETFVRHIASPSANVASVAERIGVLCEGASQVERELKALNPAGEGAFRNVAGALGITVSVYGFATGFAPATVALGGLMSLLGLVHGSSRHDQQKQFMLESQPAYVLLKAKEFAEHADG